jgi:type IV secretory pathway VirB3-like protein
VSLASHPLLIVYFVLNMFVFPMSDVIGVAGCVVLIHFLDVFVRVYSLFFPLAIVLMRYAFVVYHEWVRRVGVNRFFWGANTFQIQPFHKGLAMQADVAFCFMPGA